MKKTTIAALFALALVPPPVADAQDALAAADVRATGVAASSADPADRLAAEAYRLFTDKRSWHRAARMLEQSARMRDIADPARVTALLAAGRVYDHVGQSDAARRVFEAAAEAATARGAVAVAAHAFLDAAIVAVRSGDRAGAQALIEKGQLLSNSPHLEPSVRDGILRRLPATQPARG